MKLQVQVYNLTCYTPIRINTNVRSTVAQRSVRTQLYRMPEVRLHFVHFFYTKSLNQSMFNLFMWSCKKTNQQS